jgi:hypothetical protein
MYAVMATAAAQRAVDQISHFGNTGEADRLARYAEIYLVKSLAAAAQWTYVKPRIKA